MRKARSKPKKFNPKTVKYMMIGVAIALVAGALALLAPHIGKLFSDTGRQALVDSIRDRGAMGVLLFIGLQILQVVIFIVPGEVIEVAGGILYGTWGGYAICTLGSVLGTILIYQFVKRLRYDNVNALLDGKFRRLAFLKKKENAELAVFILYFIPGTPKDALTYFIPFTKMSLARFLLISTIARFPSVISSTFAGASLESGNTTVSIIAFTAIAVLGAIGILIDRKYIRKQNETK